MKERTKGFLAQEKIDHDSEIFSYISELHEYLWEFVRVELPGASGNIDQYVDIALENAKHKAKV